MHSKLKFSISICCQGCWWSNKFKSLHFNHYAQIFLPPSFIISSLSIHLLTWGIFRETRRFTSKRFRGEELHKHNRSDHGKGDIWRHTFEKDFLQNANANNDYTKLSVCLMLPILFKDFDRLGTFSIIIFQFSIFNTVSSVSSLGQTGTT